MLWNSGKRGTAAELVQAAGAAIRAALPDTWTLNEDPHPVEHRDAMFTIVAPDGTSAIVLIECKSVVVPRDVRSVVHQLKSYAEAMKPRMRGGAMLIAPFVSPTTRGLLEQHGLGWFDSTGNLRLRLDEPAVFIDRAGADRSGPGDSAARQLKSLRGPAAARVVLELCEAQPPIGVRELAERAQVSLGTSARVLGLLAKEAVLDRGEDGAVTAVRKRSLVERWALDHNVMTSNEVITALDPRGLQHALDSLSDLDIGVTVTGSAAARAYLSDDVVPVSPLVSLSLYASNSMRLMAELGLRRVERGANVLVMRPYDEVVHTKARQIGGLACAAPAQVVADLMTGSGRSSEEAEQLLAALVSREPGWER